ncbi:glycosyltransferase involved in cell wall biosynthesis [Pontibacter ummariensis]|uniref:Glycosyltransferase involved in cell wall bisynthesis n=1 Tax=Pontibacter ummariensis TaxID=1610492 RepID=A0A239GEL6_9BACT|nr:glycosyltransferase family 4 protein [Pontibacter ummariensis]PRY11225.1 glycosyltransferase involved in cell wall biosynthesis [Pontibacter ummariensis]SNS67481.1 Glycosyltransferase involved in cell wall bisynthesis [Pontibacter ummariensis]
MRILIIHNHYKQTGGEDTVFFAEIALLEEHGHTVETLTFSNNDVNSAAEKLQAALGVVYNYKGARAVDERIKLFKPDVVHVHNFFPLLSPAVFYVCQKHQVPVVMTLHNYRLICPSTYLHYHGKVHLENVQKVFPLKPIKDGAYRDSSFQTASVVLTTGLHKLLGTWRNKVNLFIALTPGAAALFQNSSLQLKPEQLVVKPNFTADLGLGAEEREEYFLYVGRLSPEKGLETLLEAQALRSFKLKVIGDGPLREAVEAHAAKYPALEYLGYQKRDRVVEELKRARGLIFPSEWPEMFGMSIIEAFSTATPVIAARIGGGEYLVQDGCNGLHYQPGDARDLANKVKELEQNKSYALGLGKSARQDYLHHYTPEVNYQLLLNIYQRALGQKKESSATVHSATVTEL